MARVVLGEQASNPSFKCHTKKKNKLRVTICNRKLQPMLSDPGLEYHNQDGGGDRIWVKVFTSTVYWHLLGGSSKS